MGKSKLMTKMLASREMILERLTEFSPKDFFNARTLGFALSRAWIYLLFLSTVNGVITWNGSQTPAFVYGLSSICLALTLVCSAFGHRAFIKVMRYPLARMAGPLCMTIGTLLLVTGVLSGELFFIPQMLGAVLTGVGSGLINLGWGEAYKQIEPRKTLYGAPFAFFLAAILFPVFGSLPPRVGSVLCALLPLLSGWILFGKLKVWKKEPLLAAKPLSLGSFVWKLGAVSCLLGLADGVVRMVLLSVIPIGNDVMYRSSFIWASALSMVIIYSCALFIRKLNYGFMYRPIILIMALFFMLLPVIDRSTALVNVMALVGYQTFTLFIWIILAEAARNYRLSSVFVFGIGWGMITFGAFLGSVVAGILQSSIMFSEQTFSIIALVAAIVVFFCYMFILNEKNLLDFSESIEASNVKEPERTRPFQERCKEIATEYELSARETEVMILFAKGRSTPHIQEDLFISRGTVTTHLRHIYQKLAIHDKQQLLDLIEGKEPL
jgi:DNA-binding CsgD family transcriptional regulator